MRIAIQNAASLLALACAAAAQPASLIEATAAVNPDGRGAHILVHNRHTAPLTAFVFIYTLRGPDSTVYSASTGYYDSLIDPVNQKAIPPGEEIRIPYYAGNRGMTPLVGIEAALFADGATVGHRNMVQTILERRNYTAVTLNKLLGELRQALKNNTPRDQLVSQMQTSMNDERIAVGNSNNDLVGLILTVRNQVLIDLLNARNPADGSLQPMDKFLPAEIENLSKRRELLLSK